MSEKDKNTLINADILIYQHLKREKIAISNKIVLDLVKDNCLKISLPHYVFSGYCSEHLINVARLLNIDMTNDEVREIVDKFEIEDTEILNRLKNSIDEIVALESTPNQKIFMADIIKNNYQKYRLFNFRGYPTDMFFFLLTKELLKFISSSEQINIDLDNFVISDFKFANHLRHPILPCVARALGLKFDVYEKYQCSSCLNDIVINVEDIYMMYIDKNKNDYINLTVDNDVIIYKQIKEYRENKHLK